MIAKGPKCGRLFPLHIPTPSLDMFLFASTNVSKNNVQLWHYKLGHPNSKVFLSLLNSGHINKMKFSASDVAIDCTIFVSLERVKSCLFHYICHLLTNVLI